jgi:hypothetical protein
MLKYFVVAAVVATILLLLRFLPLFCSCKNQFGVGAVLVQPIVRKLVFLAPPSSLDHFFEIVALTTIYHRLH